METKKIGLACFIGGVICAIALLVAPVYWYFGLVIGFAGGYLSYEFMDVILAIPKAWHFAVIGVEKTNRTWRDIWRKTVADVREWFSIPHPFAYLGLPFSLAFVMLTMHHLSHLDHQPLVTGIQVTVYVVYVVTMLTIGLTMVNHLICIPFGILAFIGARVGEESFWWPPIFEMSGQEKEGTYNALIAEGYKPATITYWNVYRWILKGMFISAKFFVWTVPKSFVIGLYVAVKITPRFAVELIKLIHSDKRLLCGVDGTLGGSVIYMFLAKPDATIAERIVIVFAGGAMGALFGILNWEIVSKRILHVAPTTS